MALSRSLETKGITSESSFSAGDSKFLVLKKRIKDFHQLPKDLFDFLVKFGFDPTKDINEDNLPAEEYLAHRDIYQCQLSLPKPPISWLVEFYAARIVFRKSTKDAFKSVNDRLAFLNKIDQFIQEGADSNLICRLFQCNQAGGFTRIGDVNPLYTAYGVLSVEKKFDSEEKESIKKTYLSDVVRNSFQADPNALYFDGDKNYITLLSDLLGCNNRKIIGDAEQIKELLTHPEIDTDKAINLFHQCTVNPYYSVVSLLNQYIPAYDRTDDLKKILDNLATQTKSFELYDHILRLFFDSTIPFSFTKLGYQELFKNYHALVQQNRKDGVHESIFDALKSSLLFYGTDELAAEIKLIKQHGESLRAQFLEPVEKLKMEMKSATKLYEIPDTALRWLFIEDQFDLTKRLDEPQKTISPLCFGVIRRNKLLVQTLLLNPNVQAAESKSHEALKLAISRRYLSIIYIIGHQIQIRNPLELFQYALNTNPAATESRFSIIQVLLEIPQIEKALTNQFLLETWVKLDKDQQTRDILLKFIRKRIPSLLTEIDKNTSSIIPDCKTWKDEIQSYLTTTLKITDPKAIHYLMKWLYNQKIITSNYPVTQMVDLSKTTLQNLADHCFWMGNNISLPDATREKFYLKAIVAIVSIEKILGEQHNGSHYLKLREYYKALYSLYQKKDHEKAFAVCEELNKTIALCSKSYMSFVDVMERFGDDKERLAKYFVSKGKHPEAISICFSVITEKRSPKIQALLVKCLKKVAEGYCKKTFVDSNGRTFVPSPGPVEPPEDKSAFISDFNLKTKYFVKVLSGMMLKNPNCIPDDMQLNFAKYLYELAYSYEKNTKSEIIDECYQNAYNLIHNYKLANQDYALFETIFSILVSKYLRESSGTESIPQKLETRVRSCISLIQMCITYFSHCKKGSEEKFFKISQIRTLILAILDTFFKSDNLTPAHFKKLDALQIEQCAFDKKTLGYQKAAEIYHNEMNNIWKINDPTSADIIKFAYYCLNFVQINRGSEVVAFGYNFIKIFVTHHESLKNYHSLWTEIRDSISRSNNNPGLLGINSPEDLPLAISTLKHATGLSYLYQEKPDLKASKIFLNSEAKARPSQPEQKADQKEIPKKAKKKKQRKPRPVVQESEAKQTKEGEASLPEINYVDAIENELLQINVLEASYKSQRAQIVKIIENIKELSEDKNIQDSLSKKEFALNSLYHKIDSELNKSEQFKCRFIKTAILQVKTKINTLNQKDLDEVKKSLSELRKHEKELRENGIHKGLLELQDKVNRMLEKARSDSNTHKTSKTLAIKSKLLESQNEKKRKESEIAEQKKHEEQERKERLSDWRIKQAEQKELARLQKELKQKEEAAAAGQTDKQEEKTDSQKKNTHLTRTNLLSYTIKHLTYISAGCALHDIDVKFVKDAKQYHQLRLETHYSLLYDIFRCFAALRIYQAFGGSQGEKLNEDLTTNMRNMIHHYGSYLNKASDEVLETARQFAEEFPDILLSLKKPYSMQSVFSQEQLTELTEAINFVKKDDPIFAANPEMKLVIDETNIYKQLNAIVEKHAKTVGQDEKKDAQESLDKPWELLCHFKTIMEKSFKGSPERKEEIFGHEDNFRQQNAVKMILSHLGEFGNPATCDMFIREVKKNTRFKVSKAAVSDIINFYTLLKECRQLHNRIGHEFPDFGVNKIFEIYELARKIQNKPDMTILTMLKDARNKFAFHSQVRTYSPGDTKSYTPTTRP